MVRLLRGLTMGAVVVRGDQTVTEQTNPREFAATWWPQSSGAVRRPVLVRQGSANAAEAWRRTALAVYAIPGHATISDGPPIRADTACE